MIASVVRAGWLNLRRDRAALMLSFIVPIVFFSIFAGIFGAQKSRTPKTTVVVVTEEFGVVTKVAQEPVQLPQGFRSAIEAARKDAAGEPAGPKNG